MYPTAFQNPRHNPQVFDPAAKITTEKDYSGEPYPYWGNPVETLHVDECDNRKTGNVWNYSHVHYISCKQMFADKLTCKISSDDPATSGAIRTGSPQLSAKR